MLVTLQERYWPCNFLLAFSRKSSPLPNSSLPGRSSSARLSGWALWAVSPSPRRPLVAVASSTSTSSRRTSSSTTSSSCTASLRTLISSLTTGRFSTTTSSSVTGMVTSSSPISASEASRPWTGTRSTETSSCRVGTLTCSRSVLTSLRTLTSPASRSLVPALSSSSVLCTLSSSSSRTPSLPRRYSSLSSRRWSSLAPSLLPARSSSRSMHASLLAYASVYPTPAQ